MTLHLFSSPPTRRQSRAVAHRRAPRTIDATSLLYIDCEFVPSCAPRLLSLAIVSGGGDELYLELSPYEPEFDELHDALMGRASGELIMSQWGLVPGAQGSIADMARRTAAWLRRQIEAQCAPTHLAFDHRQDFELLVDLLERHGLWAQHAGDLRPMDLSDQAFFIDAHPAFEHALIECRHRGLDRHHALADACALRAGHAAVLQTMEFPQ